jgi:hypothetical protein
MTVRPSVLVVLAALLLCAGPARAEEKIAVSFRTHWKAGDVVTHVEEELSTESVQVVGGGGKAMSDETKTTETNVVYVIKCLEADASGHMTRGIVHFSEFSIAVGADKDETLKGRSYRLAGVGKQRKMTPFGDPTKSESEAAMAWFAKNLGAEAHDEELADVLTPKAPVAAGDAIDVPMKALAQAIGAALPIDVEKSTGKVTIESISAEEVTHVYELLLETKGLPGQDGTVMAWAEGGKMTVKHRESAKPGGDAAPVEASEEMEWAGTTVEQQGTFKVVVKFGAKSSLKRVLGGDLPAGLEAPIAPAEGAKPDAAQPDAAKPDAAKPGEPVPTPPK